MGLHPDLDLTQQDRHSEQVLLHLVPRGQKREEDTDNEDVRHRPLPDQIHKQHQPLLDGLSRHEDRRQQHRSLGDRHDDAEDQDQERHEIVGRAPQFPDGAQNRPGLLIDRDLYGVGNDLGFDQCRNLHAVDRQRHTGVQKGEVDQRKQRYEKSVHDGSRNVVRARSGERGATIPSGRRRSSGRGSKRTARHHAGGSPRAPVAPRGRTWPLAWSGRGFPPPPPSPRNHAAPPQSPLSGRRSTWWPRRRRRRPAVSTAPSPARPRSSVHFSTRYTSLRSGGLAAVSLSPPAAPTAPDVGGGRS
uniref:Uncharacterized protein n=1 Tax=uncultured marine microorganism HF4000_009L19 TaxID=455516 RepID=B3T1H5_9ZZZZ|nr:hypothetical protein ALOHA_HF4000009L19ctg2g9 [uncultured marine microorganism HF4000_009L19]